MTHPMIYLVRLSSAPTQEAAAAIIADAAANGITRAELLRVAEKAQTYLGAR